MNIFVILCNLSEFASRFQLARIGAVLRKVFRQEGPRRPPPQIGGCPYAYDNYYRKSAKKLCAHNTFLKP